MRTVVLANVPESAAVYADWMARNEVEAVWLEGRTSPLPPAWWQGAGLTPAVGVHGNVYAATVRRGDFRGSITDATDPRWGLGACTSLGLHKLLSDVAAQLGVCPAISAGATGLRLLGRDLHRRGWLEPPPKLPDLVTLDLCYVQAPPRRFGYVHTFDTTGAYLSAARNSMFGAGPVLETLGGDAGLTYQLTQVHRLTLPRRDRHLLPVRPLGGGAGWYAWPVMERIIAECPEFEVGGGRHWHSTHRTLRPWAELLWQARLSLSGEAAQLVKHIAVSTIGLFGHHTKDDPTRLWWQRPDWRAEIVARNAVKQARSVAALENAGVPVVGVYVDAIAIGSELADPFEALAVPGGREQLILRIGAGLGLYRHASTVSGPWAQELQAVLAEPGHPEARPAAWFGAVKRYADH